MCTGIRLTAQNGDVVYGRTLEFGQELASKVLIVPAHFQLTSQLSAQQKGLHWKSKYAVAGANAFNVVALLDGLNEKGLAGGLFYFPGFAHFQEVDEKKYENTIAPWELLTWILTTCANVDEVIQELPKITVGQVVYEPWGIVPPVHLIVHDAQGRSVVIEYMNGRLIMYENPLGVFTNAPYFEWHIINLSNYMNISALNYDGKKLNSVEIRPVGQGSGMLGLPGDFTPPSRFVRAVEYSQSVDAGSNADQARDALFHVLNLFQIPKGTIVQKEKNGFTYDYTQWTSANDLKNKRFYWHTYHNRQIFMVDLAKIDRTQKDITTLEMFRPADIKDAA